MCWESHSLVLPGGSVACDVSKDPETSGAADEVDQRYGRSDMGLEESKDSVPCCFRIAGLGEAGGEGGARFKEGTSKLPAGGLGEGGNFPK